MSERARLQRALTRASVIASTLFVVAAALPLLVPQKYETLYLVAMGVCIALATWWTVRLQRLKKQLQETPPG
jgi:Flp pilus assembly protein TadB